MNNELFTAWLLFQQIINDIETLPIYSYTKKLLRLETKAEKKVEIIKKHIKIYNLKIKS